MTTSETLSIDHIFIEVERENGVSYVNVRRSDTKNNDSGITFIRGDEVAAVKFFNSLAPLFGVGAIVREENKP